MQFTMHILISSTHTSCPHVYDTKNFLQKLLDQIEMETPLFTLWKRFKCSTLVNGRCEIQKDLIDQMWIWDMSLSQLVKFNIEPSKEIIVLTWFQRFSTVFKVEHPQLASFVVTDVVRIHKSIRKYQRNCWKKSKIEMFIKVNWSKNFHIFLSLQVMMSSGMRVRAIQLCKWNVFIYVCIFILFFLARMCVCLCVSFSLLLRKKIDTFCLAESEALALLTTVECCYNCLN